jgi:GTP cyclohydrolase I
MDPKKAELEHITRRFLQLIGETPEREGLQRTPERVAKSIVQLTCGYEQDPADVLLQARFKEDYKQMVVVKDIEFYSLCEHHLLPFFGKVHIGYIPDNYIVGLSKLPRMVDIFARRLQVQEHLTVQIRRCLEETLHPRGVIVVVEAQHLCMQMRGVEKQGATTRTIDFCGDFAEAERRQEFFRLLQ